MIHDIVVEEKRYTGDNAPRDSFNIIGAYANHSDAYMAAKKQLVSAPLVTGREMINRFVYGRQLLTETVVFCIILILFSFSCIF